MNPLLPPYNEYILIKSYIINNERQEGKIGLFWWQVPG
jgi:hypothetical protein